MAPLTWKLLLATATVSSGQHCAATETCEDQTALLQSHLASHKSNIGASEQAQLMNFPKMDSLTDPDKRKSALMQFENTAKELAENKAGVTPLVVEVCTETAALLRDTVMQAIESEHDTDVAMLQTQIDAFTGIEAQRVQYAADINAGIAVVTGPGGLTQQCVECRTELMGECTDCFTCEERCEEEREECEICDAELRLAYIDVIDVLTVPAYCDAGGNIHPPSTDTIITMTDHHLNKEKMEIYIAKMDECAAMLDGQGVCGDTTITCTSHCQPQCTPLNTKIADCQAKQAAMETGFCHAEIETKGFWNLYQGAFVSAAERYLQVEASTRIMEADRKVEWDTLERVICLLTTLTNEDDGSASSVSTADQIQGCQDDAVDTTHLDIVYLDLPDIDGLPDPLDACSEDHTNNACYDQSIEQCQGDSDFHHDFPTLIIIGECMCDAPPINPLPVPWPPAGLPEVPGAGDVVAPMAATDQQGAEHLATMITGYSADGTPTREYSATRRNTAD